MRPAVFIFLFSCVFLPPFARAAELQTDVQGIWRAQVVEVTPREARQIPGTDVTTPIQDLKAEILEGPQKGTVVEFENDFTQLSSGDYFFMNYLVGLDRPPLYSVREPDRRSTLIFLGLFFCAVVIFFGRKQGARSLVALAVSFALILFVLLPLLLEGYSPLFTATWISTLILGLTMVMTHGLTRETLAAFLGSSGGILATGVLAYSVTIAAQLSGYAAEESVFLNLSTRGALDMQGLLLGAIMIGAIGVMDDVAMTQASAVDELIEASGRSIGTRELYGRAMRIGREHIGAVVNTLALAYAGAALPLLLLFSLSTSPAGLILNQEIFAVEIVRTIVGSIGLILAVPATTYLAILLSKKHGKAVIKP